MNAEYIKSRYVIVDEITRTDETTTWNAHDLWLDTPVVVVTPDVHREARFEQLASLLRQRASPHLVDLYDCGRVDSPFVVHKMPGSTLVDTTTPCDETEVLSLGRALGAGLAALHSTGAAHCHLHPGAVEIDATGRHLLAPWPMAEAPPEWQGPGGFGEVPGDRPDSSRSDDVYRLGALLLSALAGPPLPSDAETTGLQDELASRAPVAVHIAARALSMPEDGGYDSASAVHDDCAAALAGRALGRPSTPATRGRQGTGTSSRTRPIPTAPTDDPAPVAAGSATAIPAEIDGRRMAGLTVAVTAAVLLGVTVSGALGARHLPRLSGSGISIPRLHEAPGRSPGHGRQGSPPPTVSGQRQPSSPPTVSGQSPGAAHEMATVADLLSIPSSRGGPAPTPSVTPASVVRQPSPTTSTSAPASTTTTSSSTTTTSAPTTTTTTTTPPPSTTSTTTATTAGSAAGAITPPQAAG